MPIIRVQVIQQNRCWQHYQCAAAAGDSGVEFRKKYSAIILPALRKFKPDLLLISAGFDAHKDDPLSSIRLIEDDFNGLPKN